MNIDSDHGAAAVRHDGWTTARQLGFLRALAGCGSVTLAAEAVEMSASSAYRRRGRNRNDAFAYGWRAAQAMAYYRLRDIALERIEQGVETATTYRGEVVATKRVYSDRLLVSLLNHLRPEATDPAEAAVTVDDPGGDYAATVAAYEDAIAAGGDPVRPVLQTLDNTRPVMTRADFIAAIRMRPRVEPQPGEEALDPAVGAPAAEAGAGENHVARVNFA